jgi:hypothetical protein
MGLLCFVRNCVRENTYIFNVTADTRSSWSYHWPLKGQFTDMVVKLTAFHAKNYRIQSEKQDRRAIKLRVWHIAYSQLRLSDQQIPGLRRDVQLRTLQNCICHSAPNVLLPQVYYGVFFKRRYKKPTLLAKTYIRDVFNGKKHRVSRTILYECWYLECMHFLHD